MAASMGIVFFFMGLLLLLMPMSSLSGRRLSSFNFKMVEEINQKGPYLGIVVPNNYEMNPLLNSSFFLPDENHPYFDFSGRRFHLGEIEHESIIMVMTGLGMVNAAIATQLLLSLFEIKGVLHYGIAGNADTRLQIGDVTIPHHWAHTGLWNWQRFGDGPDDELSLESAGDYTRAIGDISFSNYTNGTINGVKPENFLNRIWYQPEEVFLVDGIPETREHVFWIPVDTNYLSLATKLENITLVRCVNSTTCLPREPLVTQVSRGCSASIFIDNAAYREFLYNKFNVTSIEMETAGVALVCYQQRAPFIAFRALSDLAGGGSSHSNEAAIFGDLAAQNAVLVVIKFISILHENGSEERRYS